MNLNKEEWIERARKKLEPYFRDGNGDPKEYAESLYETYAIDDKESGWFPEDAVDEDISYWGD